MDSPYFGSAQGVGTECVPTASPSPIAETAGPSRPSLRVVIVHKFRVCQSADFRSLALRSTVL